MNTRAIAVAYEAMKGFYPTPLELADKLLAGVIFSLFAPSSPVVDPDAVAVSRVWSYIGELVFNMLIHVGAVKISDRAA